MFHDTVRGSCLTTPFFKFVHDLFLGPCEELLKLTISYVVYCLFVRMFVGLTE